MPTPPFFVVGTPNRSPADPHARALAEAGYLRRYLVGQRRGAEGVPEELTSKLRLLGIMRHAGELTLPSYRAESFRFWMDPLFDYWMQRQLQPGDHLISSYGYANDSYDWIHRHGGKTYLDGGNSHIEHFWEIISEEHRRWKSPYPPFSPHHYVRSQATLDKIDFIISPSNYVTQSFLDKGYSPEQIIHLPYPVDLSCFSPSSEPRPSSRPLTIVNTGTLCLRKGTPYLLEAFRLVLKKHPSARLRVVRSTLDNIHPILAQYSDLPIDWSPPLGHQDLAEYLRRSDIFVLPSLEDGFARTVTEALSCGVPVITTPNTGASDWIQSGINGEIVPIRDAGAIAEGILKWADRVMERTEPPARQLPDPEQFSFDHFQRKFLAALVEKKIIPSLRNDV